MNPFNQSPTMTKKFIKRVLSILFGVLLVAVTILGAMAVSYCSQNLPNETSTCGGLGSGVITPWGNENNPVIFDYKIPSFAVGALWEVEHGWNNASSKPYRYNVTIPPQCWSDNETDLILGLQSDFQTTQGTFDEHQSTRAVCWANNTWMTIPGSIAQDVYYYCRAFYSNAGRPTYTFDKLWWADSATSFAYHTDLCPTCYWMQPNSEPCVKEARIYEQKIHWKIREQFEPVYLNTTWCNQDFANQSVSCGAPGTGTYSISGTWEYPPYLNDGIWDAPSCTTIPIQGPGAVMYINYTIPPYVTRNSYWHTKDLNGTGHKYMAIPGSCWTAYSDRLALRAIIDQSQIVYSCYDGASWATLGTTQNIDFNRCIYEEEMVWEKGVNANACYQEDTYRRNLTGVDGPVAGMTGSCPLNYRGFVNTTRVAMDSFIHEKYVKPVNAIGAKIRYKVGMVGVQNRVEWITIPPECWNYSQQYLYVQLWTEHAWLSGGVSEIHCVNSGDTDAVGNWRDIGTELFYQFGGGNSDIGNSGGVSESAYDGNWTTWVIWSQTGSWRTNTNFAYLSNASMQTAVWEDGIFWIVDSHEPVLTQQPPNISIFHNENISIKLNATDARGDTLTWAINNSGWCFQDSPTESTACGGTSGGSYYSNGHWLNPAGAINDSNWGTGTYLQTAPGELITSYIKPAGAIGTSVWQVADNWQNAGNPGAYVPFNLTIPPQCWNASATNLTVRVYQTAAQQQYYCWDGSSYTLLNYTVCGETQVRFFEEGMWWQIGSNTTQPVLTLNTSTGLITNSPGLGNVGNWSYKVSVTDGTTITNASFTYEIKNRAPAGGQINITPLAPGLNDSASCNIQVPITDADGDTLTYAYNWFRDGTSIMLNSANLPSNYTGTSDQVWYCTLNATDTLASSPTLFSGTVVINSTRRQPQISNSSVTTALTGIASTTSNPTFNNSWVNMSVTFYDANSASNNWTAYFCRQPGFLGGGCLNGEYCHTTINSSAYPTISCRYDVGGELQSSPSYNVYVLDSSGLWDASSGVFEVNHPPTIPSLNPANGSWVNTAYMYLSPLSYDVDGDAITYYLYGDVNLSTPVTYLDQTQLTYLWPGMAHGSYYYWKAFANDSHGYQTDFATPAKVGADMVAPTIENTTFLDELFTYEFQTLQMDCIDQLSGVDTAQSYVNSTTLLYTYHNTHLLNTGGNHYIGSMPIYATTYFVDTWRCQDKAGNIGRYLSNDSFLGIYYIQDIPVGGGGGGLIQSIVTQEAPQFCGDGICNAYLKNNVTFTESPGNCPSDCRINVDNMFTCIFTDPKSCLYAESWFVNILMVVIVLGGAYLMLSQGNKPKNY